MLCQRQVYETGPMSTPLGQGAMFQIYVDAINGILGQLSRLGWPLYEEPRERWYRVGADEKSLRQFLVQDLDGYLIMFAESLGTRPVR
jgi:hypothetical protein